jgi:hypothetical protein
MDIRHGWVEAFHGDELVLALPDMERADVDAARVRW